MKTKLSISCGLLLLLCSQPAQGQISIVPQLPVNLGNVNVGTTSQRIPVTLTNGGTSTLTVQSIALSPSNTQDFKVCEFMTAGCAAPVPPFDIDANGGVWRFEVSLTPQSVGNKSANVEISHGDPTVSNPVIVPLVGIGTAIPQPSALTVNPSILSFSLWPERGRCNRFQEFEISSDNTAAFDATLRGATPGYFGLCVKDASGKCPSTYGQSLRISPNGSGGGGSATKTVLSVFYNHENTSTVDEATVDFTRQGNLLTSARLVGSGSCKYVPPIEAALACQFPCYVWQDPRQWLIDPQIWMSILVLPIFVLSVSAVVGGVTNGVQGKALLAVVAIVAIAATGKIGAAAVALTTVGAAVKALRARVSSRN